MSGRPSSPQERQVAAAHQRIWTDRDGRVCAYGHSAGGVHLMDVPGVASFWFDATDGSPVSVRALDGIDAELLDETYRRMVVPMVLHVRGREVLHASAIRWGSGVIALCAVSGTGKSTLAYALSSRGHPLWADDVVVLDVDDGITAVPLPFRLRLTAEAASSLIGGEHVGKRTLGDLLEAEASAPLVAIYILDRSERDRVERIRPSSRAFVPLLTHSYNFDLADERRKRLTVENYLAIAAAIPIFSFDVPAGLDGLDSTLDRLEATLSTLTDPSGADPGSG